MTQSGPRFHALLIGIDAYRTKPLYGCVNDVDAVRRLLVERAGIPPERIRCLASPREGAPREPAIGEEPATLANLRAALAELAERARPGDRVFLYYSGHGARLPFVGPGGDTFHREALVPVDVDATPARQLLFDHELNERLAAIAGSVTCIFDCCHAAGTWRTTRARYLDPRQDLGWTSPREDPSPGAISAGDRLAQAVEGCHVVCACLAHELALETTADDGTPHGLLTCAFLRALGAIPDRELRSVRWHEIWEAMRAIVETRHTSQHLWKSGSLARPVLIGEEHIQRATGPSTAPPIGPLTDGDPGLSLRRAGDGYELDAGTLASVTERALIAVYGEQPVYFPPLGSSEDLAARRGLVRVTSARLGSATAILEGAPFELPAGARGRIVEAGRAARLRCAIVPRSEAIAAVLRVALREALRASLLLELVDAPQAQVRLEQRDERWLLTDDVHDGHPAGALLSLGPADLRHARAVLEHYYRYALPLRMAASVRDLPGALRLTVLACTRDLPAMRAQEPDLPEAPTVGASAYEVRRGARVCFRVRNTSHERLRVTLLNSAASGRVQVLGDQVIDPSSAHVFWYEDTLGSPFVMTLPSGREHGIDRFTAVGTTSMSADLTYLRVDRRFDDVLAVLRGGPAGTARDVVVDDDPRNNPPAEQWTATQALIATRAR